MDPKHQVLVRKSAYRFLGGPVGVAAQEVGKLRCPGYEHMMSVERADLLVQLRHTLALQLPSWRFRFEAGVVICVDLGVI